MKLVTKAGWYILLCAISFVLVMFGSRFVTLRFGQLFPDQSPADRTRISALEKRIQELEGHIHELNDANAKNTGLEEENKRLTSEVEAAKHIKPVIVYQNAISPSSKTTSIAKNMPMQAVSPQGSDSNTVHKGDSMEKVRRVFGRPQSVHNFTFSEVWYYDQFGTKSVTFKSEGVSEWTNMPVEP